MSAIRLDVVSDVVCPWCWLGKRRLDAALAQLDDLEVEVTYRPFELDPDVPEGGVDYAEYMKAKFGDLSRIKSAQAHLTEAGREAGITYRFEEIPNRPNTLNAHRLIRWAHGQGVGAAAKDALFAAHFDTLRDIGDPAVLADIAGEIGLDRDLVAELLATDRDADEVRKEEAFFREIGVNGVPTYIVNGRAAVSGAQEPEMLVRFLRNAAQAPQVRHA
jgi:predicted DsbA family dithiol-disulfide isomerase